MQTSQTRQVDQKLDLLFVVDNSGSMAQEQASLARNFPLFMRELERLACPTCTWASCRPTSAPAG